jgi:hypothetical protein
LELMKSNGFDVSSWYIVCLCDDQLRELTWSDAALIHFFPILF